MTQIKRRTHRSMRTCLVSLVTFVFLLTGTGLAQEKDIVERGQYHYQRYCEVCHGETGKGDGPIREQLTVAPADLTRLRQKNQGAFPFWRLYRTIDGREAISGHGSREMPIWGNEMRIAEQELLPQFQEDLIAGRIWQLILYVESLQTH